MTVQLSLAFEAPPPLQARYPNIVGWMLNFARTSYPKHEHYRASDPAIWICCCGKTMTGIKGATQ